MWLTRSKRLEHESPNQSLFALVIVLSLCGCDGPAKNGRYEIHSGVYEDEINFVNDPNRSSEHQKHVILKLDTQTGKTWRYFSSSLITTNEIISMQGWAELTNSVKTYSAAHSN